ncbi:site-specific integrase [Vibrio hangzhouensis]|uniref:site-specific integrase n=1 Tax=Vibrio hangzhouensis TaxID=462991 RepID=UPI001C9418D1|nr:site-specific integrase [Vibrio hangzhouensis]MBY6197719.1 site-specific integrase [Vibrio hangzhouensis]
MRYLRLNSNGIWTFRFRIPERYKLQFGHRREIKRSLGRVTKDIAIVKGLQLEMEIREQMASVVLHGNTYQLPFTEEYVWPRLNLLKQAYFIHIHTAVTLMSQSEENKLLFSRIKSAQTHWIGSASGSSSFGVDLSRLKLFAPIQALYREAKSPIEIANGIVSEFKINNDCKEECRLHDRLYVFVVSFYEALYEARRAIESFEFDRAKDIAKNIELITLDPNGGPRSTFYDKTTNSDQKSSLDSSERDEEAPQNNSKACIPESKEALSIDSVVKEFKEEKELQKVAKKTISTDISRAIRVHELIGKKNVFDITRNDVRKIIPLLRKLPSNPDNGKHTALFKDKTAVEWLEINEELKQPVITEGTVGAYLASTGKIYRWAKKFINQDIQDNWKDLVSKKQGKQGDKRDPFTRSQLALIFQDTVFVDLGFGTHLHNKKPHYARYWIPLLQTFTGARPNELAQLKKRDIKEESGITYISIDQNDEDQSTKNSSSIRRVPIHSTLIRLNFLGFIKSIEREEERLFPELTFNESSGYSDGYCDWFNNKLLPRVGVEGEKLSSYSMRHTFAHTYKEQDEKSPIVSDLMGHSIGNFTFDTYGSDLSIEILKEKIEKLDFEEELKMVKPF